MQLLLFLFLKEPYHAIMHVQLHWVFLLLAKDRNYDLPLHYKNLYEYFIF